MLALAAEFRGRQTSLPALVEIPWISVVQNLAALGPIAVESLEECLIHEAPVGVSSNISHNQAIVQARAAVLK